MEYKKVMLSLPAPLLKKIEKYSQDVSSGNKSGFMADAAKVYIRLIDKAEHTAKMRQSYVTFAEDGLRITKEWETMDFETWGMLQDGKKQEKRKKSKKK